MFINKNFTFMFLSSIISVLGGALSYIAIYWSFNETNNVILVAGLSTTYFIFRFVFSLFLSPVSDMYEPNVLMRNTMLYRALLLLLFGSMLYFFKIDFYWLLLMVIAQTALESVYYPASTKLIKRVVKTDDLSRANAMLMSIERFGALIGLIVGGFVVSMISLDLILVFEGVAYVTGAMMLMMIPLQQGEKVEPGNWRTYVQAWAEGIKFIVKNKWMMGVMGVAILSNLAIAPTITLMAPYSSDVLKGNSNTFSFLEIAGVVGSIAAGVWLSKVKIQRVSLVFGLSAMLEAFLMIVLGLNHNLYFAMLLLFLNGLAIGLFNIPFSTLLQKNVPDGMLGRVRGGLVAISKGASSLGYLMSGVLANSFGIGQAIVILGVLGMLGIVTILITRPFQGIQEITPSASA